MIFYIYAPTLPLNVRIAPGQPHGAANRDLQVPRDAFGRVGLRVRVVIAPLIFAVEGFPAGPRDGERLLVESAWKLPLLQVSASKDAIHFWKDHLPLVVDEHVDVV